MLLPETRNLLDLMDAATKGGRPKLETLPHAVGRKAVDKMSEDGEADPPEVAEVADGGFMGPASEIRFRRYRPLGAKAGLLPTLIYYHGGTFGIELRVDNQSCGSQNVDIGSGTSVYGTAEYGSGIYGGANRKRTPFNFPLDAEGITAVIIATYTGQESYRWFGYDMQVVPENEYRGF